jgi:assimilatory nitrate reductase catalytic subunit
VDAHGPDAVGFYISGQLLTEDYYVFNKLAKGLIGTNNVDSNSRLCMSSAVAGYKQHAGHADSPPTCYEDVEQPTACSLWAPTPHYAHPVLFAASKPPKRPIRPNANRSWPTRAAPTPPTADLYLPLCPAPM